MTEALRMAGALLCLAAMVGFCLLVVRGGSMDDTSRPPTSCEHSP